MPVPESIASRLRLPIVASPMFICSGPELVVAQCRAGIVGSFPALNARPAGELDRWLTRIEAELADHDAAHPGSPTAPFAVNQIVHGSNDRLEHDLEVIVEHRVPVVITSLGARTDVNDAVHSYGGIVLHDVISNEFARKAIDKGADGLIAVAAGAGGHAGTQSPFALVQEIREWFEGPLLLSGSIAHGRSILAALAVGADLAYIGSAFLSTTEANVDDAYRQMILDSSAKDIVYSDLFSGVHGNYLRGSIERAGLDPDRLDGSDPSAMTFVSENNPNAKAWRDIWGSGQGIGPIRTSMSVADLVASLALQFQAACDDLASLAR